MKNEVLEKRDEFKEKVKDLRLRLNTIKTTGILDKDFERDIKNLKIEEEEILKELIPYFRTYSKKHKSTSELLETKESGSFRFNSFLSSFLRLNENLFIVSGTNKNTMFFYIDEKSLKAEWSENIKEIKENISYIYKIDSENLLLFGIKSGVYLLNFKNKNKILNINRDVKVQKLKTNFRETSFGRTLRISENIFLTENGEDKINLYKFNYNKKESYLEYFEDVFIEIKNWTNFQKIKDNYFVVSDKLGKLCFIEFKNNKFNIIKEIKTNILIRNISLIERENSVKDLLVLGEDGKLLVLNLGTFEKNLEINNLSGNLFTSSSNLGTVVVLSEDGIIYIIEENFSNWELSKNCTIKNTFATDVISLKESKYLLMNLEGKFDLLNISRINNTEDLWNLPLY